jgi:hypothetical protein
MLFKEKWLSELIQEAIYHSAIVLSIAGVSGCVFYSGATGKNC